METNNQFALAPIRFESAIQDPAVEALRKDSREGLKALKARTDIGFFRIPSNDHIWNQLKEGGPAWVQRFNHILLLGIGGSSLGPQSIEDVFGSGKVSILDNPDPVHFERVRARAEQVGWDKMGVLVVSKSGSTLETLSVASLIVQEFQKRNLQVKDHFAAITEPKQNSLRKWAESAGFPCFDIPLDVGGRYSVLTAVGMLPALFMKTSLEDWRSGAAAALQNDSLVVEIMAQALASFRRQEWITMGFMYSTPLRNIGGWWQQLWAESLAKKSDRTGKPGPRVSTPVCALGANDQHSLLQQLMEGHKDKWIIFHQVAQYHEMGSVIAQPLIPELEYTRGHRLGHVLNVERQATYEGLHQSGASVALLELKDLSAFTLGYYYMTWQLVVGALGECLNIDAFSQPGVELAKSLAKQKLIRP